jgi:hypothetical protein
MRMSKRAVAFVHTRDIAAEQALVREKWKLVHANVKLDQALTAFLTQGLDNCGIKITQLAFELVQQILNPKGYVRLDHKSELSNIGALVRTSSSAWGERGKNIATRWDFGDSWMLRSGSWAAENHYKELKLKAVKDFCKKTELPEVGRDHRATYIGGGGTEPDTKFALTVLDTEQKHVKCFTELPNKNIARWQTTCSTQIEANLLKLYEDENYAEISKKDNVKHLEPYWRFALRIKKWQDTGGGGGAAAAAPVVLGAVAGVPAGPLFAIDLTTATKAVAIDLTTAAGLPISHAFLQEINDGEETIVTNKFEKGSNVPTKDAWTQFLIDNDSTMSNENKKQLKNGKKAYVIGQVKKFLKDKDIATFKLDAEAPASQQKALSEDNPRGTGLAKTIRDEYGYWLKHRTCTANEKPDVVLKVGYFSEHTGLYTQRCIIAEIDGHDKTAYPGNDKRKVDSIKLAQKLMTSTSAQAVLQPETYHIRTNLYEYLHDHIQNSLLATTNVELPDFEEFIKTLTSSGKSNETQKFLEAVHWVHHLFLAKVKIAFLIHMREAENIDMFSNDKRDPRMRDHYFFVNFTGYHLPDKLVFQHATDQTTKKWLEGQLMLLTRPKIKCNENDTAQWKYTPVVNASSTQAQMRNWHAKVRHMQLPLFPYEENRFMHIACATVQRVDMTKLCEIVKDAAHQALVDYNYARQLRNRGTTDDALPILLSRQFPDRHFLTRSQQFDRTQWWNTGVVPLRQCSQLHPMYDQIEFNWGYETPERKRIYNEYDPRWDQIDVRMHFFHNQMINTEWQKAANGMWFIQDYVDFMGMIQQLPGINDTTSGWRTCSQVLKDQLPNCEVESQLPVILPVHERACHRFSVLSWFFDCRDAGACQYKWENWVLEYFGVDKKEEGPSDFEKFAHVEQLPEPQWQYFSNPWFAIVLFLEQNFRNAIAPMHYNLFHFDNEHPKKTSTLQEVAKIMFNRQTSMLNNRSVFHGLQVGNSNGASLLSFQRYDAVSNKDMTLRERIMSQLHEELPGLDPFLKKYIMQFRIPDAELFLRMIRCPNVLALRELAVQHRHLLGGQSTASSVQPLYHVQNTLKYFPIAVQSEILYMLKFVERDDSVYVHSPAIHEQKLMLVSQNVMRQWIKHTLEVAARVQSLRTPLQVKCYMFTMPTAFYKLKNLFYTTEAMMNYASKRAIFFVLLQMRLALLMFKYAQVEYSNPLVQLFAENKSVNESGNEVFCHKTYQTRIWKDQPPVRWTPGTCLQSWPCRDTNQFQIPCKEIPSVLYVLASTASNSVLDNNLLTSSTLSTRSTLLVTVEPSEHTKSGPFEHLFTEDKDVQHVKTTNGVDENNPDMLEEERCFWLLLIYSRPQLNNFTAEDMTTVRQIHTEQDKDNKKKDTIVATLTYEVSDHKLMCTIQDDTTAPLFFEKLAHKTNNIERFPAYVCEIITKVPDRKYIYVPDVFAKQLRKDKKCLHNIVFEYDQTYWKMVCVGTRAWAWKRLMTKSIFYNAFQKVMTRSSVQLSLYGHAEVPEDPASNFNLKTLLQRHNLTTPVFGDLQDKQEMLKANHKPKLTQLIFSEYTTTNRRGSIDNSTTEFREVKIPNMTRQVQFARYFSGHVEEIRQEMCNRFMLVDKRICAKLMEAGMARSSQELEANEVLVYRSYLYTLKTNPHMIVKFKNQTYIRFPRAYAVIRCNGMDEYKTGKIVLSSEDYTYGTCFDTRTYSCLRYKQRLKADSEDMMSLIKSITKKEKVIPWSSTNDLTLSEKCNKFIYTDKTNKTLFACPVKSVIWADATDDRSQSLPIESQKHMYTLPDLFTENNNKIQKLNSLCQKHKHAWTQGMDEGIGETDKWIILRCTTKYIYGSDSENNLQFNDRNFENELLKNIMEKINTRTTTP